MKRTRTFAVMNVSRSTYEEVRRNLEEAGYDQAVLKDDENGTFDLLDMHGIALSCLEVPADSVG